jgi:putative hydrolase of the HAD superfamily
VRAILIDAGGVLIEDFVPAAAAHWTARLGLAEGQFLSSLYNGSDEAVLTGAMSEAAWWDVVAGRLGISPAVAAGMRRDLARRGQASAGLTACLRRLRGRARTAIVSNCWPEMRPRLARTGLLALTDDAILSCETGVAKPDPGIYAIALERLQAAPADALFIDDTPANVAAAQALGLSAHLHADAASTAARMERFVAAASAGPG